MAGMPADRLYTREFFQVFTGVVFFMTGVALQFHFGQYVAYLGYEVDTLGLILSLSMIGTLAIRLHIGRWIDRFGCRSTWLVGAAVVALTVGSVQFVEKLWLITVLRAVSTMATAAVMTTVAVFAALIAPPQRRAESIGTIGLAGFMGMVAGPTLGDWIFSGATNTIAPYRLFFTASALFSLFAGGIVLLMKVGDGSAASGLSSGRSLETRAAASNRPSPLRVALAHWPGVVLLIGVVFSLAFCLQSMYLERLAEARGFNDIKLFFLTYAPTAIVLRLVFRRLPERIGRSRTLVLGLVLLAIGQLCLTGVFAQWQLLLPGFLMGAGHCFIFPSMVDLAAARLPLEYRGTGTALILGAGDVGMLIGYGALGGLIEAYGFDRAIEILAVTVLLAAAWFAIAERKAVVFRQGTRRTDAKSATITSAAGPPQTSS